MENVEITGYVKVISENSLSDDHLDWYARGGMHTLDAPCEGSALKGWLSVSGIASWVKEIWFPGGYTDQRDIVHTTSDDTPILVRWIGWKVVMYNINNNNNNAVLCCMIHCVASDIYLTTPHLAC